jgi:glycosyltransferase involved in cell wall biosynthesis
VIQAVGIVVPAHDEEKLIPSCLASLRRAEEALTGVPVHLVVVADACRDQTAEVARQAGAIVVTIGARCVGAARAAGVREVLRRTAHLDPATVWLANTDADTVVPPNWLAAQAQYAASGWDAVAGTIRVGDWTGYRPGIRSAFGEEYTEDGGGPGPHAHGHVHGANLGFRAQAYLTAGGFPPVPTGEDRALIAAMTASGSRVLSTATLTVVTSARRHARAPDGFSDYLADLDARRDTAAPG